ncbi:MAG TPA: hypothetical protein IAB90_02015 [Candidatus Coproplasma stercoripullorum]|uniref:Uncharacterized protein n=1 Tax=Candidatus Coproplasma stercoripullorum TaxID=2840751 RepID=A0A9D1DBC5_9FIRM|nr:hypothetical protein [Candidatus Coproplasma stercoripullorum]
MNLIKKQGAGTWISLGALVLALIALIIYGAALSAGTDLTIASGSEMFYDMARTSDIAMTQLVPVCGSLALVFLALAIVLGELNLSGTVGKVCGWIGGALRIVAPALIIVAVLNFLYGSFTGLGWTFFSNEELVIYPEATAVGQQVITGLVFFVIAAVAAIVAAFFGMRKKEAVA